MTGDRRTDLHPTTAGPALSGGPWLSDDHAAHGARYEPGGKLGAGGMGEVRLARDTILDRDVALKTPRRAEDDGALLAEARVTARLEHPSILPIYDAGRLDDGAAFYATRVFTGRTLADALEHAATVPERLKLIRHLLAVAQAIAYAHKAGVLHRDLKPANVMIGSFGETVVSDWGLATRIEGAVSNGSGTPGFMAPEQAAGGPIGASADIYAVGAMLRLLTLGALPGAEPRLEGAPPELVAIATTATAARPGDRYPSMAALAADLEAWLDGRRVQAHVYSTAELTRRLITRWRAPIAVAVVGLALVITAVAAGWWRTAAERDRARLAEAEATRARILSQRHLAEALVTQARFAADDDRRTEAEVLAAQALQYGPSPEARGVLARFGGRPRPTAIARGPLPPCLLHSLSSDGMTMVCQQAEEVLTLDLRDGVRLLERHAARAAGATVTDGQMTLAYVPDGVLAAWRGGAEARIAIPPPTILGFGPGGTPNEAAMVVTGRAGWARVGEGAAGSPQITLDLGASCSTPADVHTLGDAVIVSCIGGELIRVRPGRPFEVLHQLSPASPAALATDGEDRIAVGTTSGELVLLDAEGEVHHRVALGRSAARRVVMNQTYVALLLEEGTLSVVERAHGTVVLRVSAPETSLAWLSDGRTLRTANDQLVDWQLPELSHPHRTTFHEGLSAMAVDPAGGWVAVGTGDGGLDVFRLHDGAPLHHRDGSPKRVVKDFGVSPDGARVVIALSGPAPQPMVRAADWTDLTPWHTIGMRRIGFMGDVLVGVTYDTRIVRFDEEGGGWRLTPIATADAWDADITPSAAVALTTGGELWQLRDPSEARLVTTVAGTRAVATLGEHIVTAGPDGVRRISADGQILGPWPLLGDPVEVVTAHHQRWIVVGTTGGVFQVLHADTGETIAVLRGHTGRGNLARFTADDAWLVTGSWDRDARVWYTADLEAPVEDVLAQVTWDMPLSEALRQGRR
jgi:hypothetical protein